MGKLDIFQIRFSQPNPVFFPGNTVNGDLQVQLKKSMNVKAIQLKFVGKAYVHWTESQGTGSGGTETVHYKATEFFFNQTVVVFGEGSANEGSTLSQGQHLFPFNFRLPDQLPSSYEGGIGFIRYHVKGTIVKPRSFNKHTIRAFSVLDTLDLNNVPAVMSPSAGCGSKVLCCCCCKSGPISVEFSTDRSGYVPGEWILINATLKNQSNSDVRATSVQLRQQVIYHASKSRSVFNTLSTITGGSCKKRSTLTWTNERLHIPPVPPSELMHCRIIDIHYFVQFKAHLRTCAVNLKEMVAITIGTIPVHSLPMNQNPPQPTPAPSAPTMPIEGASYTPALNTSVPAPSYAAATGNRFSIVDNEEGGKTVGDTTFSPQYTFYDWNQSAFTYNK